MIGVEPRQLAGIEQLRLDQPPVDRRQRQRLEGVERFLGALDLRALHHQHQVLDPDAVFAGFVIARLVRQDHAALQRRVAELGDARRALVHRQIAADAVAGAVIEVEAVRPQRLPRERIELRAGDAFGKHRARDGDVALQHQREALAHFGSRLADRDGAGDVGGAVLVLAAGVDQEQFAGLDGAVGRAGDPVMHDGAVRPGAGDARKRHVLEQSGVAAEALQRLDRADLGELAVRRLAVEPGEEARHRRAVADMRRARARDLDRVLDRLHHRDRVGPARHLAAGVADDPRQRIGGGRLVEPHRAVRGAERLEVADEGVRLAHLGALFELVAHRVGELGAVDVERRPAVLRHDGEGERQRRVGDVGAADVEGPGHRMRIGDHQRVGAQLADLGADFVELGWRRLAGEFQIVQHHRAERRRRPVVPDRIDRVGLGRHQLAAGGGAGARQPLGGLGGVQPGVVAELGAGRQVLLDPFLRRGLADVRSWRTPMNRPVFAPEACSDHRRKAPPRGRAR